MKDDLRKSFIFPVILAGIIIFFICCAGCTRSSYPSETATQPVITVREMPARTYEVTPAATKLPSPRPAEPSRGTPAPGTGSLTIWSSPPACSVYIDGMYAGDTPAVRDSFTKVIGDGPHTITITKIGYGDYRENVFVPAGKSLIITVTLTEKPYPYYTLNPTVPFTESFP